MIDIKETILGLYSLKTYLANKAIEEAIEGHDPARESLIGMQKVIDSAVNALKEQEAVKPVKEQIFSFIFGWVCGACGFLLLSDDYMYCPRCGKKVKWDD